MKLDTENFQTPLKLCKYIVQLVDIKPTDLILEPTAGAGNFCKVFEMDNLKYVPIYNDFFKIRFMNKYDYIIGNPPFTPMTTAYKITEICFNELLQPSGELIFILPWLFLINSTKRMKTYYPHLKQIILLDRTVFKGSRIQCAIFHLSKKRQVKPPILSQFKGDMN